MSSQATHLRTVKLFNLFDVGIQDLLGLANRFLWGENKRTEEVTHKRARMTVVRSAERHSQKDSLNNNS